MEDFSPPSMEDFSPPSTMDPSELMIKVSEIYQ